MGRKFKFAKTELQYSGQNAKPKYVVIEFLPEQVGTLTKKFPDNGGAFFVFKIGAEWN